MIRVPIKRLPEIQVLVLEQAGEGVSLFYRMVALTTGLVDELIIYQDGFIITTNSSVPEHVIEGHLVAALHGAYGFENVTVFHQ